MSSRIKFFVVLLFSLSMGLAYANPGKGGGQGKGHGGGYGKNVQAKSAKGFANKAGRANNLTRFSTTDRTAITNFFDKNPLAATALPPGIAMNLARGKPLPPGIAKRSLPSDLLSTLPARPGYEYLVAGNDVVLVNSTTGIIADILAGVLK